MDKDENLENKMNAGAKIKKSYTFGSKEPNNNGENELNNKIYNINSKNNLEINYPVKKDKNDYEENIISKKNFKNSEFKKPEMNKTNDILNNIDLNNRNNHEFIFEGNKNNKKLEKRDKSAPKISINQKINNFYSEKPLSDKKHDNFNNINHTLNYDQLFNNNNNKRTNNTEDLYQKLLMNFNINSSSNKRDRTFYNFNSLNNNIKFNREDNPNKSYGQINVRDTYLLYETNGKSNYNYYNLQKRNYYRNGLNLDHLKDLYSKKTEDIKRPTQSIFKSKMDMFYQELKEYNNANYNKKKELKNYSKKNKYMNNNNYMANTQYNDYIKNNESSNKVNYPNQIVNDEKNNENKNIFNGNKIGYNEILAVKRYLNDLTKEEVNNLSIEIQQLRQTVNNLQNRVQVLEGYAKQIREMKLQPQTDYTSQYRYGNNHQIPIQPQQQVQANKSPVYTANTHTAQYHQQNNNQYNQYKKGWNNIPNQQYGAPSNITYNQQYGYVYR